MTTINYKLKSYKELIVWQKSFALCKEVYALTEKFPKSEQFGLTSQLRRCSTSIPSNIAEGYNRYSKPHYLRFLYIANGSLAELETQLLLSYELNYLNQENFREVKEQQAEVQRIMMGLIKSLR